MSLIWLVTLDSGNLFLISGGRVIAVLSLADADTIQLQSCCLQFFREFYVNSDGSPESKTNHFWHMHPNLNFQKLIRESKTFRDFCLDTISVLLQLCKSSLHCNHHHRLTLQHAINILFQALQVLDADGMPSRMRVPALLECEIFAATALCVFYDIQLVVFRASLRTRWHRPPGWKRQFHNAVIYDVEKQANCYQDLHAVFLFVWVMQNPMENCTRVWWKKLAWPGHHETVHQKCG